MTSSRLPRSPSAAIWSSWGVAAKHGFPTSSCRRPHNGWCAAPGVPVLTVKAPYRGPYGLAVAAIDDTDPAEHALAFALAACPHMRVVAFHAVDLPAATADRTSGAPVDDLADFARPIQDRLAGLADFDARGRFSCERGEAMPTLDRLVSTHAPDLVVLGRPRRGWSFLLGQDLPGHALMGTKADVLIAP